MLLFNLLLQVFLMAIPPEPISEVLPDADAVVLAEVTKVIRQDPMKKPAGVDADMPDAPVDAPAQGVELSITRVLKGPKDLKVGQKISVEKPAGDYALRAGNKGPFLLKLGKDKTVILGRYGPDTYRVEEIEQELKRAP